MWTADEIDAENEKYRTEVLVDDANAIDLSDSDEVQELDDEEADIEDEEATCDKEEVEGKNGTLAVDEEDEEDQLPPLHMEEELLTSETSDLQELRKEIIEKKAKLTIKLPPRRRRHRKTDTSGTQEYASDAEDEAKPLHRKRKHTPKRFSKKPRHHGKVKHSRGQSDEESNKDTESTNSRDNEAEVPAIPVKRARGRPKKLEDSPDLLRAADPNKFSVSLIVEVEMDPIIVPGKTAKGNKVQKVQPVMLGPAHFTQKAATWDSFLALVGLTVKASPENLRTETMKWHWSTGKRNGTSLSSAAGFQLLLSRVRGIKPTSNIVVVTMSQPLQPKKVVRQVLPWEQEADVFDDGPNKENLGFAESTHGGLLTKKVSVDKTLATHVETLKEKYKIGDCDTHLTLRCFPHAGTGKHFHLDSNRLKVWALAIHHGTTNENRIPLGQKFFQLKDALADSPIRGTINDLPTTTPVNASNQMLYPGAMSFPPSPYFPGYPPSPYMLSPFAYHPHHGREPYQSPHTHYPPHHHYEPPSPGHYGSRRHYEAASPTHYHSRRHYEPLSPTGSSSRLPPRFRPTTGSQR